MQIFSTVSLYTAVIAFTTLLLSKKAFKTNHWGARKTTLGILLLAGILFLMFTYLTDVVADRPVYQPVPVVNPV
jgi:ascorbate-specific PTS system EIIC-type component UlaA